MTDPKDDPGTLTEDAVELEEELEEELPAGDDDEPELEDEDAEEPAEGDPQGEQGEDAAPDAGGVEDEDDLPTDPVELRKLARARTQEAREAKAVAERFERILATRPPQTGDDRRPAAQHDQEAEDLANDFAAVAADPDDPRNRLLLKLTDRLLRAEQRNERKSQAQIALEKVPPAHRTQVQAIVDQYNVPVPVAHQLWKGVLFDQAVARKKTGKGGSPAPTTPAEPAAPRPTGSARPTALRPVPPKPKSSGGDLLDLGGGFKVPSKFTPDGYATFMDGLTPDQKQKVFKARRAPGGVQIVSKV